MMLFKVDPLEVAEIRRVGFLGWVNALAMKSSSGIYSPCRARLSSGVHLTLKLTTQGCAVIYRAYILPELYSKGWHLISSGSWVKTTMEPLLSKIQVIYWKITFKTSRF